ncbi:hypothetical protein LA080_014756 [Diaporthe eres]|nr:hypothetical protein LA080_014756 [Diaporthe eres]
MAAFRRYAPAMPRHATPRHATPELVPSRVLEAGYRRAVKVGAVMRLKGLEGVRLEASRKLPSAMGSPLRDGRPGSSRSPNGCALHSPPHGTARAGRLPERLMEAMETLFCWLSGPSAAAVKTGPSKPEILGAILWASLANAGNVWHVWQVVGAALAGPVPKRESMMARAAPEMGTAQEKQAPRPASECNIGFSQRATVDPGRRHDTSPRSRHEADAFRQLMLGGRDWS